MNETYYDLCKECEHLFHCFGKDAANEIANDEIKDQCIPGKCNDFYPEVKQ